MLRKSCFTIAVLLSGAACLSSSQAAEGDEAKIDFVAQVQPLLLEHCGKCHGEKKKLGKLQLHTAEAIQSFHEEELIVAGKPDESELIERISLPADNKKRMPKGADPLKPEQIELLRKWIAQGALFTAAEAPAEATPSEEPAEEEKSESLYVDDAEELADVQAAAEDAINQVTATGASVMALFADSPLLQVSFAQAENPADDAAVAALPAIKEQIVWLNLAGTKASPAGLAPLAELKHLSKLNLKESTVNDDALAHLAGLERLHYLNIYGGDVTDAGLEHLKGLKRLRRLYLWKTKVSYDAAMALQEATPGLEVNLGWDHPEVARRRITKQLEDAKKQAEESVKNAEEAQKQLEAANKEKEQAESRVNDLQSQLDALNAPEESGEEEAAEEKPAEEKPDEEKPAEEAKEEKADDEKAKEEKADEEKKAEEKADEDKKEDDAAN